MWQEVTGIPGVRGVQPDRAPRVPSRPALQDVLNAVTSTCSMNVGVIFLTTRDIVPAARGEETGTEASALPRQGQLSSIRHCTSAVGY